MSFNCAVWSCWTQFFHCVLIFTNVIPVVNKLLNCQSGYCLSRKSLDCDIYPTSYQLQLPCLSFLSKQSLNMNSSLYWSYHYSYWNGKMKMVCSPFLFWKIVSKFCYGNFWVLFLPTIQGDCYLYHTWRLQPLGFNQCRRSRSCKLSIS